MHFGRMKESLFVEVNNKISSVIKKMSGIRLLEKGWSPCKMPVIFEATLVVILSLPEKPENFPQKFICNTFAWWAQEIFWEVMESSPLYQPLMNGTQLSSQYSLWSKPLWDQVLPWGHRKGRSPSPRRWRPPPLQSRRPPSRPLCRSWRPEPCWCWRMSSNLQVDSKSSDSSCL